MTSLIGCCDSLYLNPCAGSSSFGALISTPAIGPATEGLRGLELFFASHAVSESVSVAHSAAAAVFVMISLERRSFSTRAECARARSRVQTHYRQKKNWTAGGQDC